MEDTGCGYVVFMKVRLVILGGLLLILEKKKIKILKHLIKTTNRLKQNIINPHQLCEAASFTIQK